MRIQAGFTCTDECLCLWSYIYTYPGGTVCRVCIVPPGFRCKILWVHRGHVFFILFLPQATGFEGIKGHVLSSSVACQSWRCSCINCSCAAVRWNGAGPRFTSLAFSFSGSEERKCVFYFHFTLFFPQTFGEIFPLCYQNIFSRPVSSMFSRWSCFTFKFKCHISTQDEFRCKKAGSHEIGWAHMLPKAPNSFVFNDPSTFPPAAFRYRRDSFLERHCR